MTMPDILTLHAGVNADKVALVDGDIGKSLPCGEVEAVANGAAHAFLAAGARPGERMVWCGPNSVAVMTTIHAGRKAHLTAVPLSYRFVGEEMQYVVDNSDATLVVIDAEQAPLLYEVRDRLPKVRNVIVFGGPVPEGWLAWDAIVAAQPDTAPEPG